MARLRSIFGEINNKDLVRQEYFAEKLVESLLLLEGKTDSAYNLDYISKKIINEAMKKDSVEDSLKFVDGVFNRIDEGFMGAVKGLGKAAWGGIKKVASKIKDTVTSLWDNGGSLSVIKKWNNEVSKYADKLEGIADSLDIIDRDYLMETALPAPVKKEEEPIEAEIVDDAEETENKSPIDDNLLTKDMPSPKPFFKSIPQLNLYQIVKDGSDKVLKVGDDENAMVSILRYTKAKQTVYLDIPETFEMKQMDTMKTVLSEIATNPDLGLDTVQTVELKGLALVITTDKMTAKLVAGKRLILSPIKAKVVAIGEEDTESEETPAPAPATTDEPTTTEPAAETPFNKKIIDIAIGAKIKDNSDGFYDRMQTTPEAVWSSFDKFAEKQGYMIANILRKSNTNLNDAAPMSDMEFYAYMGNMRQFISNLQSQPAQQGYDEAKYKTFLAQVLKATDGLETVVNRDMDPGQPAQAETKPEPTKPAAMLPSTEKTPATEPVEQPRELEAPEKTELEKFVSEYPTLNKKLDKGMTDINKLTVARALGSKTLDAKFLDTFVTTNDFLENGINTDEKIRYIKMLRDAGLKDEQIKTVTDFITSNELEDNFHTNNTLLDMTKIKNALNTPSGLMDLIETIFNDTKL